MLGTANAIWVVSENHIAAAAALREPLPCSRANSSSRSCFRQLVSIANNGYRTRYPLVAATTTGQLG